MYSCSSKKVILIDGQKSQKVEKPFGALVRVSEDPKKLQHCKNEWELKSQRVVKELRH